MRLRYRLIKWLALHALTQAGEQSALAHELEQRLGWHVFGMIAEDDVREDLEQMKEDGEIDAIPGDRAIQMGCDLACSLDWSDQNTEVKSVAIKAARDFQKEWFS